MYVQSILAAKGTEVATIAPDATVRDAVALLNERRVGALVVSSDGRTIGASSPSATSSAVSGPGPRPRSISASPIS